LWRIAVLHVGHFRRRRRSGSFEISTGAGTVQLGRRALVSGGVAAGIAALAVPSLLHRGTSGRIVRLGYTKAGPMIGLRARGRLELMLAAKGIGTSWSEFPAGPDLLEAMGAGALDFGMTGNTPPIFAAANGLPIRYVGYEPAAPMLEALLVGARSAVSDLASLKGGKVAVTRGSNAHYLLLSLLRRHQLSPEQIDIAYLQPADAGAALANGSIDAWAIWDPLMSSAIAAGHARILADARGASNNHYFYIARTDFAAEKPLVALILDELHLTGQWINDHPIEAASVLEANTGLAAAVWREALSHARFGAKAIDAVPIVEQQRIADTFLAAGLLKRPVTVSDAVASID